MLVLVGNLHLADGTCGASTSADAVDLLADRLADLTLRASWRSDGAFRPIDRVDIVLLGDTLDLIHSKHWLGEGGHLAGDLQSPATIEKLDAVVEQILDHNAQAISLLRAIFAEGALRIPVSDGSPGFGATHWQPVSVRAWMMAGSHDWPLCLTGAAHDAVREKVIRRLGLANRAEAPLPHDPADSEEILEAMRRRRAIARPGDIHDPLSFCGSRQMAGAANLISIELITRFLASAEESWGEELTPALRTAIRELPGVWPNPLAAAWLGSLLDRLCPASSVRATIKRRWDELADAALAHPSLRERLPRPAEAALDGLADALLFARRPASGWINRTSAWLRSLRDAESDSLCQHAMSEPDFRNRRARHVVYGHSRLAECLPLEASYADGFVLHQTYFNLGAWSRVWRATQWSAADGELAACDTLSLLALYEADERGGRPYEMWTGVLGAPLTEAPPRERHLAAPAAAGMVRPALMAHEAHIRQPHFPALGTAQPITRLRR